MSFRRTQGTRHYQDESYLNTDIAPDYDSDSDAMEPDYGSVSDNEGVKGNRNLENHGLGEMENGLTPVEDTTPDYSDSDVEIEHDKDNGNNKRSINGEVDGKHTVPTLTAVVQADIHQQPEHSEKSEKGVDNHGFVYEKGSVRSTMENGGSRRRIRQSAAAVGAHEAAAVLASAAFDNKAFISEDGHVTLIELDEIVDLKRVSESSAQSELRQVSQSDIDGIILAPSPTEEEVEEIKTAIEEAKKTGTICLKSKKRREIAWGINYHRQQQAEKERAQSMLLEEVVVEEGEVMSDEDVAADISRRYASIKDR